MGAEANKSKQSARQQNETILAGLYEEYYDRIVRYVYVRIGDKPEAEDLTGEVFLKAVKSLDSYQERGLPMQAWLFRIAHNLVVDYFRQAAKRKTVSVDVDTAAAAEPDPQDIAQSNAELIRVSQALGQLTAAQREVIELRFFGGLSSEETGQILGKSGGAVREMQSAAIRQLRNILR